MGTISEKLTYLNDTKSLLKDSINSLGGEITSQTTFRQYATELDSIYASLPKVSGTGSVLSLTPTLKGRLGSVLKGNTFQQTYTGKNLFDINGELYAGTIIKYKNGFQLIKNNDNRTLSMVLTKSLPAGEYTISSNIVSNTLSDINKLTINFRTSNSSIIMINLDSTGKKTFTLTDTATNFYVYIANSESDNAQITLDNIQIETGSSATSYEPYVGGIGSPNPSYPQEIQSVTGLQNIKIEGKNLVNISDFTVQANTNFNQKIGEVYLEAGTTYYYSYTQENNLTSNTRNTPFFNFSGTNTYQSTSSNYNLTAGRKVWEYTPATTGTYNVGFWCHTPSNDVKYSDIMISKSSDTTYEQYQTPQTKQLNLGKNLLKNHATSSSPSGIDFTVNADGSITATGTSTGSGSFIVPQNYNQSPLYPAGTYTVSFTNKMPSNASMVRVEGSTSRSSSDRFIARDVTGNNTSYTFTADKDFFLAISYIIRQATVEDYYNMIQVEKGSTPTAIKPYFTPIHLYENDQIIGTPDNWSIKHIMGEVMLDGSGNGYSMPSTNRFNIDNVLDAYYKSANAISYNSNLYVGYGQKSTNGEFNTLVQNVDYGFDLSNGTSNTIRIKDTRYSSLDTFKAGLSNNNLHLVYQLAEPTTEPITNTELISQLNALYYANSYNGTTNITITSEDLALIMNASALKGEA